MKKRIMLAIATLLVLGLAIVAFAYTKRTNHSSNRAAMECCCKDGVCPMKKTQAGATSESKDASCCDSPDCCCKGGACPMKNKTESAAQTTTVDMKNVTVASSEENCEKPCCKHKK